MALSLWEPWASAVAFELKRYETRSWSTVFRGPLAIQAARKRFIPSEYTPEFVEQVRADGLLGHLLFGEIACLTSLREIVATESVRDRLSPRERIYGKYADGRKAFELGAVQRPRRNFQVRGQQGLFMVDLPDDLFAGGLPQLVNDQQGALFA